VESPRTLIQSLAPPPSRARTRIAARRSDPARGAPEREHDLILERYRLLERLGAGGFGEVWSAHDELLHREVAVKRIWLGPDGDSERAVREAHASARLSHPAIVCLYEACLLDGAFYLISELVDGDTLARLIAEDVLEDEEVLEIGLALTGALAHAHARGVIHRDVKPQNVLIPEPLEQHSATPEALRSAAKLADFGGASLVGEDALTRTGDVLGTLAYMAPEQTEGRSAGARSDLYSLALVIYEALAGVNPVRGPTPAATARRIGRPIEPLRRRRRDLSRDLTHALDRALSVAANDRGTLEQLGSALEVALEDLTGAASKPSSADAERQPHGARPRPTPVPDGPRAPVPGLLVASEGSEPAATELEPRARAGFALPLSVWLACAALAVGWQLWRGRDGLALLTLAALAPLPLLPRQPLGEDRLAHEGGPRSARIGFGWLACALAPLLGLLGLAGAFPALAGQASRWRERAAFAALGYWWLVLAAPLLDGPGRVLWLAEPARTPPRSVWEGSINATAAHVLAPALTLAVLAGALLWALAALALPWIVRGRSAALDIVAATIWSAALLALSPTIDAGLSAQLVHPSPRGAVLGGVLGGIFAVAARALRGPI
jgi:eukaryotic-like serine/threonine-protein kinase